jgi:hypothetical protein
MTAAGIEQVKAAAAIAPALTAFRKSLTRTRKAGPAEATLMARDVEACLGYVASAIRDTGYEASKQWLGEFCEGQAADPGWLRSATHAAASHLRDGANLTMPARALPSGGNTNPDLPVLKACQASWKACHDLNQLMHRHSQALARPQVPEYAGILGALHAACGPLATAADSLAPHLAGLDPDFTSVWCEDFDGDLAAAYTSAARQCRAGAAALRPVCARATADVRVWRSRSRARPGRTGT